MTLYQPEQLEKLLSSVPDPVRATRVGAKLKSVFFWKAYSAAIATGTILGATFVGGATIALTHIQNASAPVNEVAAPAAGSTPLSEEAIPSSPGVNGGANAHIGVPTELPGADMQKMLPASSATGAEVVPQLPGDAESIKDVQKKLQLNKKLP